MVMSCPWCYLMVGYNPRKEYLIEVVAYADDIVIITLNEQNLEETIKNICSEAQDES